MYEHIELPAKLLDYFLQNTSSINPTGHATRYFKMQILHDTAVFTSAISTSGIWSLALFEAVKTHRNGCSPLPSSHGEHAIDGIALCTRTRGRVCVYVSVYLHVHDCVSVCFLDVLTSFTLEREWKGWEVLYCLLMWLCGWSSLFGINLHSPLLCTNAYTPTYTQVCIPRVSYRCIHIYVCVYKQTDTDTHIQQQFGVHVHARPLSHNLSRALSLSCSLFLTLSFSLAPPNPSLSLAHAHKYTNTLSLLFFLYRIIAAFRDLTLSRVSVLSLTLPFCHIFSLSYSQTLPLSFWLSISRSLFLASFSLLLFCMTTFFYLIFISYFLSAMLSLVLSFTHTLFLYFCFSTSLSPSCALLGALSSTHELKPSLVYMNTWTQTQTHAHAHTNLRILVTFICWLISTSEGSTKKSPSMTQPNASMECFLPPTAPSIRTCMFLHT